MIASGSFSSVVFCVFFVCCCCCVLCGFWWVLFFLRATNKDSGSSKREEGRRSSEAPAGCRRRPPHSAQHNERQKNGATHAPGRGWRPCARSCSTSTCVARGVCLTRKHERRLRLPRTACIPPPSERAPLQRRRPQKKAPRALFGLLVAAEELFVAVVAVAVYGFVVISGEGPAQQRSAALL